MSFFENFLEIAKIAQIRHVMMSHVPDMHYSSTSMFKSWFHDELRVLHYSLFIDIEIDRVIIASFVTFAVSLLYESLRRKHRLTVYCRLQVFVDTLVGRFF